MNNSALNLNSDMNQPAPTVSTDTSNLSPNKWIVAGVAISAALAVNLTEQVKEDRFDLVSNIATVSAAAVAGGVSYKLAKDVEGVPTSLVATMAGSLGILSSVVVAPAVNVLGNKVKDHFSTKVEEQPVWIVDNDALQEYLEQKEVA
ncbi:hypothetical protein PQC65_gp138 [Aeromonas phage pAEv1810]|uniref:hypothetical protein n=1 Tax=Aeromonas phage pAEv1810 TaxID=2908744 RepID=UPI0023292044|nr:hypothetical protein PQC65_gp138 [Aeromonas phage pAEv1810]UIS25076.1 hypothetical protein pAEv1810_138 [Aeromonas phage pAEv1810]